MKVEAVRDDGAVMVTEGSAAAVVLLNGRVSYNPKESYLARGGWEPAPADTPMPEGIDPARLAAARGAPVFGVDNEAG